MNATMALCTLVQKRFEGAFTSSTVKPHALRVAPNHPRSNNLRLAVRVQAAEDSDIDLPSSFSEPDTARAAIEVGLKLTQEQRWEDAQVYFERALTLPGTGIKRFRDKPKQLSDGERIAVMYNIACCQSKAGEEENIQNGLIAIAGCLETGYDNWQQLRTDPDLENLRKNEKFEGLMKKFEPRFGGFFKSF